MFEEKLQTTVHRISEKGREPLTVAVVGESRWALYVNDQEVVTFMATPCNLHHLALGFLASENLITGLDEIASVRVNLAPDSAYWYIPALGLDETRSMPICEQGVGSIQIRVNRPVPFVVPERRIITSGCGGGVTFDDLSSRQAPIVSDLHVSAGQVVALMQSLNAHATLYRETRGVHTSALADGSSVESTPRLLAYAEDVGRHNTLDKIRGECLMRGVDTRDGILLSTGRISSEMITKAAKMRVPIVISRTSPTSLAVELARAWNIALIGYAHAGQMQVYNGIERIH